MDRLREVNAFATAVMNTGTTSMIGNKNVNEFGTGNCLYG